MVSSGVDMGVVMASVVVGGSATVTVVTVLMHPSGLMAKHWMVKVVGCGEGEELMGGAKECSTVTLTPESVLRAVPFISR